MAINVTFRSQLIGGVSDFSQGTNIPIFAQTINLVELIVLLARYQEEGEKLAPKVYITNDISSLCSMLPDNELIKIGSSSANASGIKQVLKKCAPLASGGWMIFIHNHDSIIDYGLFKGSSNPIAVLIDDVVMTKDDNLVVVKVFQIAENCVEIKSNNGGQHYIFLDHRQEESYPPLHYLDKLVDAITSNTKKKYNESIKSFLTRLLFESLRESHGCIIAVTNMSKVPKLLSADSVIFDEPIDFGLLVENFMNKNIEQPYITSKAYLLKGMLNSDGILIFDNRARLLGYNCFIKVSKKIEVIGGARRRAFSTLTSNLGRGLCGVFMQSQDGWSEFEEKK